MADDNTNDDGNGNDTDDTPKSGKFREKYEQLLADKKGLEARLAIYEAGLGHLSPRQVKAVIADATDGDKEITADMLKTSAKELGFPESAASNQNSEGQNQNQDQNGNNGEQNGEGNNSTNDTNDTADGGTGLDIIQRIMNRQTKATSPGSFEDKINNAKSAEEIEALIRAEGASQGIVLEADVD